MLFEKFSSRSLQLANRMVMAPMTRSRATPAHTPNALMATYYGQRATAGLIVAEGTSPSPNGLGYPRIPGLYDSAQVDGWKAVAGAVHDRGGKIFVQLMHCGRVAHVANLPAGVSGCRNLRLSGAHREPRGPGRGPPAAGQNGKSLSLGKRFSESWASSSS